MSADTFYGSDFGALETFDPEIAGVLVSELDRAVTAAFARPFLLAALLALAALVPVAFARGRVSV